MHRQIWQTKPAIRAIYSDYYQCIKSSLMGGPTLEIGCGSGNFKEYYPEIISMDLVQTPWLDVVADGQHLPFRENSFSNIVMVDLIHHIEYPKKMFLEISRILKKGGRVIAIEPAITPGSWIFLKLFHPEPIDMNADPLLEGGGDSRRDPFDANQALPTLLFEKYQQRFEQEIPELRIIHVSKMSFFAYPLSGGFRPWCLLPSKLIKPLLTLEQTLQPYLGRIMAFRIFIVLAKNETIEKFREDNNEP
jgi:SAM-dependent methyltransferase